MIISISHQKGGVGKSLLVWNIAYYLQDIKRKKVLIIDLDTQETTSDLSKIRDMNKWGKVVSHHRATGDKEMIKLIEESNADYILIDTGGFDADLNRVAIAISDKIICPANDRVTEVLALKKYLDTIMQVSQNFKKQIKVNVVVNNVSASQKDFSVIKDVCEKSHGYFEMCSSIISSRPKVYGIAMCSGQHIFERTGADAAQREIRALIGEVILKGDKNEQK